MDKLPKLTIQIVDDKYVFEKGITRQAGELLIEISEIDRNDIVETFENYKYFKSVLTKDSFFDFSEWILKALSKKYIYPIAFFITNIFTKTAIKYFNDPESFRNEMNNYLDFVDDLYKNDIHSRIKVIQLKEFEKNIGLFANTALFVNNPIFKRYDSFLPLLNHDIKSNESDEFLSEVMELSIEEQDIEYKIVPANDNKFIDYFYIGDLISFLIFDTRNVIKEQILIKKCKNCDGYFIPQKRSDALYCNRSSPQEKSMTCKEYGSKRLWYDKLKNSTSNKLYRNIYMAKQMLAKRNPDIQAHQDDFKNYKEQSAQWRKDMKEGIKTEEEFITWLKTASGRRYLDLWQV